MDDQASWSEVFDHISKNRNTFLFGGMFVFVIIMLVTIMSITFFSGSIHPTSLSFMLMIFYTITSLVAKDKKQEYILIREAICYTIATLLFLALIGSPFGIDTASIEQTPNQEYTITD